MLIDRAIPPAHGHVVIAIVDDELVCRQLCKQGRDIRLPATRPGCAEIQARAGTDLQIWAKARGRDTVNLASTTVRSFRGE